MQKRRLFTSAALAVAALGCGAVLVPHILQSAEAASANTRRIAVVYFTKSGNTQSLAEAVRAMTGADLYRIETIEPYPDSYGPATEVVKDELERKIIRPIKPLAVNLALYDVIVLATPTWWHHVAMPLQTWIKSVDLPANRSSPPTRTEAEVSWKRGGTSRRFLQAKTSARTSPSTEACALRTTASAAGSWKTAACHDGGQPCRAPAACVVL